MSDNCHQCGDDLVVPGEEEDPYGYIWDYTEWTFPSPPPSATPEPNKASGKTAVHLPPDRPPHESVLLDFDPLLQQGEHSDTPPPVPPRLTSLGPLQGSRDDLHPDLNENQSSDSDDLLPALDENQVYKSISSKMKDPFVAEDFVNPNCNRERLQDIIIKIPLRSVSPQRSKSSSLRSVLLYKTDFDGESLEDLSVEDLSNEIKEPDIIYESNATNNTKKSSPRKDDTINHNVYVMEHGLLTPWKMRWLCLEDDALMVYANCHSQVSKKVIPINAMKNVKRGMSDGKFKFVVSLEKRDFVFGVLEEQHASEWAQLIMHAIIKRDKSRKMTETSGGGGGGVAAKNGGGLEKKGYLKIDGVRGKRYFVLSDGKLAYYESEEDYECGVPIHTIDLQLVQVVPQGKQRGRIITNYRPYNICFDTPAECSEWITAIQLAVQQAFVGDASQVEDQIFSNSSNRLCADCSAPEPRWAAINMGITLCKHCAGVHRSMAMPYSNVRGIRLDYKVWNEATLELMIHLGNDKANMFWEGRLIPREEKIGPDADDSTRDGFITSKYKLKRFAKVYPSSTEATALNEELCRAVQTECLLDTVRALFSGADIHCRSKTNDLTPLQLAQRAKQKVQVELLQHNNAADVRQDNSRNVIRRSSAYHCLAGVNEALSLRVRVGQAREYQKKYCVLEKACLKIHTFDSTSGPVDCVRCGDMTLVSVEGKPPGGTIRLLAKRNPIRSIVFGEFNSHDFDSWKHALCRALCPPSCPDKDLEPAYELAGWVMLKNTAAGQWLNVWISLAEWTLRMYDEDRKEFTDYDLRKVISVGVNEDVEPYSNVPEISNPIVLSLHSNIHLYIQGEVEEATNVWRRALEKNSSAVGTTLDTQLLTKDNIPVVLDRCLKFLETHGMQTEGLYRISGGQSRVRELHEQLTRQPYHCALVLPDCTVHEVANVLKRFLRDISDPLLSTELYDDWIRTTQIKDDDVRVHRLKELLGKLPEINYKTVRKLVGHLSAVAANAKETRMDENNLAMLFHGVLLSDGTGTTSRFSNKEAEIMLNLIKAYRGLFDVSKVELEWEESCRLAMDQIAIANENPPPIAANNVKVDIYFKTRTTDAGESHTVTIKHGEDRVRTILDQVVKEHYPTTGVSNYGLFEIIVPEEVERVLTDEAELYPIVMRWADLDSSYARQVHLAIKYNHVVADLLSSPAFRGGGLPRHPLSQRLILKVWYSEKRTFKKVCALFEDDTVRLYKTRDCANEISCWPLVDLAVYLGIERRRNSPTDHGLTLHSSQWTAAHTPGVGTAGGGVGAVTNFFKPKEVPLFGRALAFYSRKEMEEAFAVLRHATGAPESRISVMIPQRFCKQ